MADELLESIDRSLESRARKVTGTNTQMARGFFSDEQEDVGVGMVASAKNKDFIDAIKNRKFGILSLAPNPRDIKIKSDLQKKLTFLNPKPNKEKLYREKKAKEIDEKIDERAFKPKLSDLTAKQIQKNLHLFRGAKVSNLPVKLKDHKIKDNHRKEKQTTQEAKHHLSSHDKEHRHRHTHKGASREDRRKESKHRHKDDDHRREKDRHHRIEKEKHRKRDERNDKRHRDYSDEYSAEENEDDFMEVRDLFDLERENKQSYKIGEYEDRLEMERQERRRQRKDRERY